ncbi:histidine kinase [Corallococcus sp. H22C18031201]|uniref:PAS domain-containing sensor histidine kinase n=1 Tax=Citreicoccus inhibens TaxID=2849499 RepID=UPI000E71D730|nr:PAS domain-containing sensor histidine kinase [Citreicoccus inhibens]MBU8894224.1 PAS domain-containing sensor histidine kinase [Citreicoccus inhibens]RJS23080.1 histidine kinase [Corallococcus sp. H22C18031201]
MAATAPLPSAAPPDAPARLSLAERLLTCDGAQACAEASVEWLVHQAHLSPVACLSLDSPDGGPLCLASHGLPPAQQDALVHALAHSAFALSVPMGPAATRGLAPGLQALLPTSQGGFFTVPLLARAGGHSVGLLVVASPTELLPPDVPWLASCLGPQLARQLHGGGPPARLWEPDGLLRRIIDSVADPILLTDLEGQPHLANARAEMLLVVAPDSRPGRRRAVQLNQRVFAAALVAGAGADAVRRREVPLVDPVEGTDLHFELVSTPVRGPDGREAMVSVLRNVTDLGRATQALGESYRRLRATEREARSERHRLDRVLDSVADPIILTDPAGATVMMNDPAEKLFALPPDAGEAAQRRVRANDAQFSAFLSGLLGGGTTLRCRGQLILVDPAAGATLPMEAVASKVLGDSGELTGVVTLFQDRTEALEKARLLERLKDVSTQLEARVQVATAELAEQNEKLRRQAIQLEQASAAKSQFLANMSHEFRTPLNAILGYTNMLLQGVSGDLSSSQKRNLTRIDSNGRHLLEVINEILDITRIEAGRMPLHLSDFGLPELLQEVTAEMDPIIARSHLTVGTRLGAGLLPVHSDRQKVKQIVLNLLSNALKFTHEGSVQVTAEYTAQVDAFSIAVVDTGIGIDPAYQEKIFEDFQQVDSSPTRAYGGTGLGLSICRRLATMLGGRVTLQSAPGHGSTFTLHFPRRARRT